MTFAATLWVFLSVLTAICLLGMTFLYRRLLNLQRQLSCFVEDGTTSFASLREIPTVMKALQQTMIDVRKNSQEVQQSTAEALTKIGQNALHSWNTFEKAMSFLTEDARNISKTVENGNKALEQTLRGYDHSLQTFESNNNFLESQANDLRSQAIILRENTERVLKEVPAAAAAVEQSLNSGFQEIRTRAIIDQLTVYPRKLLIELDERETHLELVDQRHGLWVMPCRSEGNIKFRLVCENENCQNEREPHKKEVYKSEFVYTVRQPARIDYTYLPRAGDVETFFNVAEIANVTDHLEKIGEGLLAVKLGLTLGAAAHPVFAITLIALETGLEELVRRLQADSRDRRATKQLWDLVKSSPFQIKDVGGPGHNQFGDLIRRQEESEGTHVQKSFGGLSKWMNPETHTFSWICPTDAYSLIAKYRSGNQHTTQTDAEVHAF